MRTESNTQKNSPSGIVPTAPWRVCKVKSFQDYRLYVQFMDGLEGFVDLYRLIHSDHAGVFKVLRNKSLFDQVFIDYGAVTWPGELDLAPDAMHDAIQKHGKWVLQ